ncbi:hypothetical protein NADFUDRAFT_82834 [Nadsonia fulvescens var. elongata DSM 6958]|uniref:Uncharacterized protein n=1 Tax=Nadsonia fulvescens var. elongata DSM 6958 TaxID=857566 RepID=A0A1E3PKE7_9ASCO|nr:hypothetical protein NADFUDRAFT_82834 [Nadsonia fulvescens var. elongata DSM 6958]
MAQISSRLVLCPAGNNVLSHSLDGRRRPEPSIAVVHVTCSSDRAQKCAQIALAKVLVHFGGYRAGNWGVAV